MRRIGPAARWCLVATALFAPAVWADHARDHEALKSALTDVLQRSALKSARVSAMVQSLDDGAVVFSHNPDELLNPASNVKLFTAAAALAKLGSEYRFETELLVDELTQAGKVKTLFVRGKGDPTLTTERLFGIVGELYHAGVREISGDLVIDDSWFDDERLAPGYDQESSDRAYMAPTGAVSLNWNAAAVFVRAAERAGQKAVVEVEPKSDYFTVENNLLTGSRRNRRFSVSSVGDGDRQRILARGNFPPNRGSWSVMKKIDNPPMYFGQTLKSLLVARGIKVKGKVRLAQVAQSARLIHVAQSETFDVILKRLNKLSLNFVAEQLIKTVAAEVKGPPGSFAKGIEVVEEYLETEVGIPRGSYVMKNGSGLNDTNRFSTSQMLKLLRHMAERIPVAPEYLSSMGIAGKDGTLRYRFEGSGAVGRLRAKTGTLQSVSALSGYVQAAGGERFMFSFVANGFSGHAGPVVQGLDALGAAVAACGTPQGPTQAVAEIMTRESVVGPLEDLRTRVKTYLALGKQGDKRNIPFLRTAWRSEKDPAVRAVVAESLYHSDPDDYLSIRTLLESYAADEAVFGRLRGVAKDLSIEVPGFASVVDLAAEGHQDAVLRLVELVRATKDEPTARDVVAEALAEVARTAPSELIFAMRSASAADRDLATAALARGLVRAADANHPFWPTLKKAMGALDASLAIFAKNLEGALSLKVAEEKAPKEAPPDAVAEQPGTSPQTPTQTAETRPGG